MRWIRGIVGLLVLVGLVGASADPARAGGSVWHPDRATYEPGDTALIVAAVSWAHHPDLGTPEDGPYGVWLAPSNPALPARDDVVDVGPGRGAAYVGDIEIDAVEAPVGPHVASVEFTVPDLPTGDYEIQHCNWPCTTSLGDITWGVLHIGPLPPGTTVPTPTEPPATTAPPATSAPRTTAAVAAGTTAPPATGSLVARDGGGMPPWGLALAGVTGVGLLTGAIAWLLRDRRPTQRTVNPV